MNMKFLYLIIMVSLLWSCSAPQTENPGSTKRDIDSISLTRQQLNGVNVKFAPFTTREIKPVIHANGVVRLLPESKAEVSCHISGKVDRIFVRDGMYIQQGEPLLSVSSFALLELQNDFISAKNDAEFQKAEFERQDALQKKKMGVLADYQATRAKYQSAVIREQMAKQKLEMLGIETRSLGDLAHPRIERNITVRAPLSGYINKLNIHVGSLVETETILAEIINPDALQAEVYVYEKDAEKVKEGLSVTLNFVQQGIAPVTGKVLYISRALDPENKTITLHVQFTKPKEENIHADMNVKAMITGLSEAKSSMSLPATTIYDDGQARYIFVTTTAEQSVVHMKRVRVEVLHEDDEYVVVKPFQKLPEGCLVADYNVLAVEAERKKNE